VLLAGDAAGLTDPITGEGISHAVASGRIAAEAVAAGLERGVDPGALYRRRVAAEVVPHVDTIRRFGNVFYTLGPRAAEFAVRAPFVREAITRFGPWGRTGPGEGELVVEETSRRRHQ
jgi:flavin-dependent dehydrogenase